MINIYETFTCLFLDSMHSQILIGYCKTRILTELHYIHKTVYVFCSTIIWDRCLPFDSCVKYC